MLSACGIQTAVSEWSVAIGSDHVVQRREWLQAAETATYATAHGIPAALLPASTEEVQECVRIAARHGVPVYAISGGKNWGYGSRVPAADGCVLIDLKRMNRIVDFDERLAYVTVEPGVTQGQLLEFLTSRGSKLWMDSTGASPDSSVLANAVERGFGHTPYADHFGHSCGLEVVLPDGDAIQTGFARFPNARAASLYRWGFGPTIDGLFSQSGLGIVTRGSVWLMPKPAHFQTFFFGVDSQEGLGEVVEALRPLRLSGVLRSAVHIGNDYKVLSGLRQYPWDETGGQTPLRPEQMLQFRKKIGFGAWNGSGALYGTRRQVAEARGLVRKALDGRASRLRFLGERTLKAAGSVSGVLDRLTGWDLSRMLELARPLIGLQKGIPTDQPLRSAYWRKRFAPPEQMDPDRDRCGLIWCAPILPATSDDALRASSMAIETVLRHGFEPALSLTLLTERTISCVVSIGYDRDVPDEDERARACHDEMLRGFADAGYYPYRLGIHSMWLARTDDRYGAFLERLHRTLDPAGIMAPGRYRALK